MREAVARLKEASLQYLRPAMRDVAAEVLWRAGATDPRRRSSDRLSIVTFHRVLTQDQLEDYPIPEIAVTRDEFAWFLDFFQQHFECGPLLAMLEAFRSRRSQDRRPLLAITFDDGQLDNYQNARPLLEERAMRATFFATVVGTETGAALWHDEAAFAIRALLRQDRGRAQELLSQLGLGNAEATLAPKAATEQLKHRDSAGRRAFIDLAQDALGADGRPAWDGMMDAAKLSELAQAGHEIGSHTETHAILVHCGQPELEREVIGSRKRLEAAVATPVDSFCYPNGDHNPQVIQAVRAAGYKAAVTTEWGRNGPHMDVLSLRRCDVQGTTARTRAGHLSPARLGLRLSGLQPGL